MNRPARFTQAELARAIRAASACGARVKVRDGVIEIDTNPKAESQEQILPPPAPVAPREDLAL